MSEYGIFLNRIFQYNDKIKGSVFTREYTNQRKPVFWHILRSELFYRTPESCFFRRKIMTEAAVRLFALKDFALFIGKHLCWSLSLIKFQAFSPAALLKNDFNIGVFL